MIKQCLACHKSFSTKDILEQFCSNICRDQYKSKKSNIFATFFKEKVIKPIRDELKMDFISDAKVRKSGEMSSASVIPIEKMKGRKKSHITGRSIAEIEKRINQYRKASDPLERIRSLSNKLPEDKEDDTYIIIKKTKYKKRNKNVEK